MGRGRERGGIGGGRIEGDGRGRERKGKVMGAKRGEEGKERVITGQYDR